MSNNSFKIPKLNMMAVVNEAIRLYKENLWFFIKISFIAFLINLLSNALIVFQYLLKETTMVLVYKLFLFVMMFPFLYFSIKFSIATYVCIAARYKEKDISIKGALNVASERFWKYVGVNIQFFLVLLVPFAGVIVPFFLVNGIILKWTIIAIFATPLIYLVTVYGFAPLMTVLDKEKKQYFSTSKKLVEGDIWKTIILILVVTGVFYIPYYMYIYVFNDYKAILPVNKYVISTIKQMLFVFITPFTNSVYVTLFYKLKENKRIG
ncbi:MAG: hypothetical protein N3I35_14605 [Clostridia bacterium]|nr:hypothetical protein [Clostridia bacterium]